MAFFDHPLALYAYTAAKACLHQQRTLSGIHGLLRACCPHTWLRSNSSRTTAKRETPSMSSSMSCFAAASLERKPMPSCGQSEQGTKESCGVHSTATLWHRRVQLQGCGEVDEPCALCMQAQRKVLLACCKTGGAGNCVQANAHPCSPAQGPSQGGRSRHPPRIQALVSDQPP